VFKFFVFFPAAGVLPTCLDIIRQQLGTQLRPVLGEVGFQWFRLGAFHPNSDENGLKSH
jgi:hypothetical protein